MCGITKDPRNALASWNGYEYQGQIALITILEMMQNDGFEPERYELMLEDLEDFSIYCDGELISTHQVKATSGKTIKEYAEALYYMAVSLQEKSGSKTAKAYLHTSEHITDMAEWKDKVIVAINDFRPAAQKELSDCIKDIDKLQYKVQRLRDKYNNRGKFKTRRLGKWEEIYRLMPDVKAAEEITCEKLKIAIQEYVDSMVVIDTSKDELMDRILYYAHGNDNAVDCKKTRDCIEKLIIEYWGKDLSESRRGVECIYRYELQELIGRFVAEHHKGNVGGETVAFIEIKEILDKSSRRDTKEAALLRNKDEFFKELEVYCVHECEADIECEKCDLLEKRAWFEKMQGKELERAFYMMSPHKNDAIENVATILDAGLRNCYFHALHSKKSGNVVQNCKVVYQEKEDNYLLTDIQISRRATGTIAEGLINNEIVNNIMENPEFRKNRMEIDALIVDNKGQTEMKKFDEMFSKFTVSDKDEADLSYYKITRKKDIGFVDVDTFIKNTEENEKN